MTDPYGNRDEHRPFGEGTPVPDHELHRDSDGYAEFFAGGNYPDPIDRDTYPCRNCRQGIPSDRTICGYCGTTHPSQGDPAEAPARAESQPDYPSIQRVSRPPPGADRWEWRQVIFAVVEATSKLAAIAKGSAACSFLVDTTDAITECKLVDDYIDRPPAAVVAPWGQLPTATQIDSSAGQRLLRQAIARAAWDGAPADINHEVHPVTTHALPTTLYDDTGIGIHFRIDIAGRDGGPFMPVWLVPAIAHGPTADQSTDHDGSAGSGSARERLSCDDCERMTIHDLEGYDDGLYNGAPGWPIWQCRPCDAHRFGPCPDAKID